MGKTTITANFFHTLAMTVHRVSTMYFEPRGHLTKYPGFVGGNNGGENNIIPDGTDHCQHFIKNDKSSEDYFNLAKNFMHAGYI